LTRLLLLSPSSGLGGGIERVGDSIMAAWPGEVQRLDLLHEEAPKVRWPGKIRFGLAALAQGRQYAPDLVFCLHAGLLPVGHAVATQSRARLGVWAHGTEVWCDLRRWERRLISGAQHVLASSEFTREWLAFRARVPEERIEVVALPVAAELAERARSFTPRPREPTLLTVSRLVPEHRYKGHLDVAESMPYVLGEVPDARWIVVGEGPDLEPLKERCRELGVDHATDFVGRISDDELAAFYGSASALVLPSIAVPDTRPPAGEGLGLVYVEAGAFGLPSVASSLSGGAADFVRHGETGLSVPPGRPEWIARAVCDLLTDSELRDRLGEAARGRAFKDHMPEAFAEELTAALGTERPPASRQRT
jgi:phosphatidyl-myo-inositol dimannoside synthase